MHDAKLIRDGKLICSRAGVRGGGTLVLEIALEWMRLRLTGHLASSTCTRSLSIPA